MSSEPERQTRKQRVDPKREAAGWSVIPFDERLLIIDLSNHAIEEYPTANGPVDCALVLDGWIVGVIGAKKVTLGPAGVLTQAKRYSQGLPETGFNVCTLRCPLLFSKNGEYFHFHDVRHELNLSRQIAAFYTPSALREMLSRNLNHAYERLIETPNNHPRLRPYQIKANSDVEAAIMKRKWQMLVAIGTGTGKNFTTVSQIYRLLNSDAARRIPFRVDRQALASQAVRAFAAIEPEPDLKFDSNYEIAEQLLIRISGIASQDDATSTRSHRRKAASK